MVNKSPVTYIQEVSQELSKVVWPKNKETMMSTLVVLVFCTIMAMFFLVTDAAVLKLVQLFLGLEG